MKTFRDLMVWQKAMVLAEEVYAAPKEFPKHETYGLADQARRAVVSIPANIAEGYGRQSTQDYIRFLLIARGPLYEVQTHCELAARLRHTVTESQVGIEGAPGNSGRERGHLARAFRCLTCHGRDARAPLGFREPP